MANHKNSNTRQTVLYRSEKNKVLGGVCGGLGEVFDVDPTLIRIIFALVSVFGGSGIILYFVLWIVVPSESKISKASNENIKENIQELKDRAHNFSKDFHKNPDASKKLFGVIILVLGVMFLLGNFGFSSLFNFDKLWPLILVAFGFLILTRKNEHR